MTDIESRKRGEEDIFALFIIGHLLFSALFHCYHLSDSTKSV